MAVIRFGKGTSDYVLWLAKLEEGQDAIAKKAIYEGAKIMAVEIENNLDALPTDKFRYLEEGEKFSGVPERQKADLIASFGIAEIKQSELGNWNTKLGFDGFGSLPTNAYPYGLPNNLLARAIESGSSVRVKTPFMKKSVDAAKGRVEAKMAEVVETEIKKIVEGK